MQSTSNRTCFSALPLPKPSYTRVAQSLLLSGLTLLTLLSVAAPAPPLAHRQPDPVVVPGGELGEHLLQRSLESFALFARCAPDGPLSPIPFQLDERDEKGNYLLIGAPGAARSATARVLDEHDELVFLARDSGFRSGDWPVDAEALSELELTDPETGTVAWVYLASYPAKVTPPVSSRRYVEYDPAANRISSAAYDLRFTDPKRPFTVTWTSMPGAGGRFGVDFLDSAKLRLKGKLFGLTNISRTDIDFDSEDRGYLAGPVRIIRVVDTRLRLIGKLSAPGADVIRIYYPDWVEAPIPISLPFKLTAFVGQPDVFFGSDYDLPRDGSHRYYSPRFPSGLPIGGAVSRTSQQPPPPVAAAPAPADQSYALDWHGVAGPLGAIFSVLQLADTAPVTIETVFELRDNVDEPEDIRGASPLVGRRLVGWEDVPRGKHLAYFYDFYPVGYRPGDEQAFMRMLQEPVAVGVSARGTEVAALPETPEVEELEDLEDGRRAIGPDAPSQSADRLWH